MYRQSTVFRKSPVVFKQGQGTFKGQLERILNKQHVHMSRWDELSMYDPRKLAHANRFVDHFTYETQYSDPLWSSTVHEVPDQRYGRIAVPAEYKDAYWWRDLQARRVQCPVEWVSYRMYNKGLRLRTDFTDLSFKRKWQFTVDHVLANLEKERI